MSRGTWDDEIDGEFQRVHKSVAVKARASVLFKSVTPFEQTEEEIEALALPETLSDGQWVGLSRPAWR